MTKTIREMLEDAGFNFNRCREIIVTTADGESVEVDDEDVVLDVNFRWKGTPRSLCYPQVQAYDNKNVYTTKETREGGNVRRVRFSKTAVGNKKK